MTGTFVHEYPVTLETRDGVRTIAALARGDFAIRPRQRMALYLGRTGDADLFASEVARALFRRAGDWSYMDLTGSHLLDVRRRAVNIRGVGYRGNPDPHVWKMGYTGSNVDQNAEVRRADRTANLYRITIEIVLGSGKRTIQLANTGNMLGYGASRTDFDDLADIVDEVLSS